MWSRYDQDLTAHFERVAAERRARWRRRLQWLSLASERITWRVTRSVLSGPRAVVRAKR